MTTRSEIRQLLQHAGAIEVLDSLVHDAASRMATNANNDGVAAQLEFLNTYGMTDESVLSHLQEAME